MHETFIRDFLDEPQNGFEIERQAVPSRFSADIRSRSKMMDPVKWLLR